MKPTVPPLAERRKPGLSVTLTGPHAPTTCQSCRVSGLDRGSGRRWIECDENDHPTATRLILCDSCSKLLIEKHPRLYIGEDWWAGCPGAMACCEGCAFRDGLTCTSPLLKARGGPGLPVLIGEGAKGILCGAHCRTLVEYTRAPECKGFSARPEGVWYPDV